LHYATVSLFEIGFAVGQTELIPVFKHTLFN